MHPFVGQQLIALLVPNDRSLRYHFNCVSDIFFSEGNLVECHLIIKHLSQLLFQPNVDLYITSSFS